MTSYSIELKSRKYVKRNGFLPFDRNLSNKYEKELLDNATKTRPDALKTVSKEVINKAGGARGEFIENNWLKASTLSNFVTKK